MQTPYQASPDVHVLPTSLPVGGNGFLTVNAFLLNAAEPVLVDTGIGQDSDDLLAAVDDVVGLDRLRWVWLTHDDADHTGSIRRILEAAPQATLVTHAMSAMRMATWWSVPLERVHAIRPGDRIAVGDRTLRAVAPPLYDNPMTVGFLDEASGGLFCVDSFGALIPEPTQDAEQIPQEALVGGMLAWSLMDSPWSTMLDRDRFSPVLDGVRRLQPSQIFSAHLPVASGASLGSFLDVLASAPGSDPIPAPSHAEFSAMLEGMQRELEVAAVDVRVEA
ncbi:MBL fold metallo-hydrolase [Nocardioides jiangxiensis]|uniref:MBL fold metallo-hydrolase n=1 Tax=Nocardioides jiangxiensis TaxID=3064524 RepID=A0ABT9B0W5_9ACTN|nr:MBL fold metallo-hydrolase [Nocardioides sp. WY-20]MDO7868357.1 MBL fold metallo-hydrolase [Nocardioides sp. WY-20]